MDIRKLRPRRANRVRIKDNWWKVAFSFEETNIVSETRVPATSNTRAMEIGKKRLKIPPSAQGRWLVTKD